MVGIGPTMACHGSWHHHGMHVFPAAQQPHQCSMLIWDSAVTDDGRLLINVWFYQLEFSATCLMRCCRMVTTLLALQARTSRAVPPAVQSALPLRQHPLSWEWLLLSLQSRCLECGHPHLTLRGCFAEPALVVLAQPWHTCCCQQDSIAAA